MTRTSPHLLTPLLPLLLAACGDAGAGGADADATGVVDTVAPGDGATADVDVDTTPDFATTPATVTVTALGVPGEPSALTRASAILYPFAPAPGHDVALVEGACRMLVRPNPFCDPACEPGERCAPGDTCEPEPERAYAGAIALASDGVAMTLDEPSGWYYGDRSGDLAPAGAALTATAPGAAGFGAFSLSATMPPPLVVPGVEALRFRAGAPLVVAWTPAAPGSRVRLRFASDHGAHGLFYPLVVACDAPDEVGAITIPQAMADALADRANWGCGECPTQTIQRYARATGTAANGEDVALELVREVGFYANPGFD